MVFSTNYSLSLLSLHHLVFVLLGLTSQYKEEIVASMRLDQLRMRLLLILYGLF